MRIIERKNPPRPVESNGNEFCVPDELWNLMMECWAYTSVSRPKMSWVVVSLAQQRGSYSSRNSHFHRGPVDGEINNHNLLCDNCKEASGTLPPSGFYSDKQVGYIGRQVSVRKLHFVAYII